MVRYPDILTVSWQVAGEFTEGDYEAGGMVTKDVVGRAEPNGKGSLVGTEDGKQIVFEFSFYSDRLNFDIPFGAKAVLNYRSLTVKRHVNYQTGSQIWL